VILDHGVKNGGKSIQMGTFRKWWTGFPRVSSVEKGGVRQGPTDRKEGERARAVKNEGVFEQRLSRKYQGGSRNGKD